MAENVGSDEGMDPGRGVDSGRGIDPGRGIDVGRELRELRRRADMSQRELARVSGVPHATIAHVECGRSSNPSLRLVERLVEALGARLTLSVAGHEPATRTAPPSDEWRDGAGRRYPAHLDARKLRLPEDWWGAWWAATVVRDRWPLHEVPEVTFDLSRPRRDERRARMVKGETASVRRLSDVPGCAWVAELGDGTPVGLLCAHEYSTERDRGLLAVSSLCSVPMVVVDHFRVRADYRECGIGRRLVDALVVATNRLVVAGAAGEIPQRFLRSCGFVASRDVFGAAWYECQGERPTS